MPFITEEIWQKVKPLAGVDGTPSCASRTRSPTDHLHDPEATAEMEWVMQFILGVRRIKGEMNIPPGRPLPVLLQGVSIAAISRGWRPAGPISISWRAPNPSPCSADDEHAPESAIALVGEMKILIPMAGLIDKDAELARLDKEIARITADIARTESKLANANFVDKAPPAVVQKERDKIADLHTAMAKLHEQSHKIRAL